LWLLHLERVWDRSAHCGRRNPASALASESGARSGALDCDRARDRSRDRHRMKPRHRRYAWIGAGVLLLGVAAALVLNAFQSNLVFFFSPTDVAENRAPQGRAFRIGGMVVEKSLARASDGLTVR